MGRLIAQENAPLKETQNVNRYEMKVVPIGGGSNNEIYVLNKENGTIWRTRDRSSAFGKTLSYDPWIKLPPLPIEGSPFEVIRVEIENPNE